MVIAGGLDISTKTGCVILEGSREAPPRVLHRSVIRAPKGVVGMPRCHFLASGVADAINEHLPREVVVEGYSYGSRHLDLKIVEVSAIIQHMLWCGGVPVERLSPSGLKKFATGRGKGVKKPEVVAAVAARWGFETTKHDEADAFVAAAVGLARAGALHGRMTREMLEVLGELRPLAS